jgi:hypothetical protein
MGISGVIVGKMGGGAPTRGMGRGRGATKFGCFGRGEDGGREQPCTAALEGARMEGAAKDGCLIRDG